MAHEIMTKKELLKQFKRFHADKNRGISMALFAEMCGMNAAYLDKVFIHETESLSETTQIRVSRTLEAHRKGQLRVMEKPLTRERHAEYRPRGEEKPRIVRAVTFTINNGKIGLQPRPVNRQDFSRPSLDELLGD